MKKILMLLTIFISINHLDFAQSPYIYKVFEFCPAPGQFVNVYPKYNEGDTYEVMLGKVENEIVGIKKGLVSLGAYGGYIVFGFDHLVENIPGKYDFKIWGNAYYLNSNPPPGVLPYGSCEPGIVMVSYDANGNGIPDDPWYELAGSEYHKPQTIKNYEITYYQPDSTKILTPNPALPFLSDTSYIRWTDNQENSGFLAKNKSHNYSYYPLWISEDSLVYEGTKLANNGQNTDGIGHFYIQYAYPFGYADNHPNENIRSNFDIDRAVDVNGNKVNLPGIHFVKVYTGVNQYCGLWGETSTEIVGAEDFHIQGVEIDVLAVKTELFHEARVYYSERELYIENLEGSSGKIYNINGQVLDSFNINSGKEKYTINLISGVYFLTIEKQNNIQTYKFNVY
ncbi:MAG: T9SS type A sorting domain-containing protein [Bacteroidales bacterium]|jgi:hypothetical protein|nr:T9SS type A sorting domain-containing protein [Bacteroidales bacterium]